MRPDLAAWVSVKGHSPGCGCTGVEHLNMWIPMGQKCKHPNIVKHIEAFLEAQWRLVTKWIISTPLPIVDHYGVYESLGQLLQVSKYWRCKLASQRVALTLNLVSSEPCKGQYNSIANESTRARGTSSPAEERNHVARALDPPKSRRWKSANRRLSCLKDGIAKSRLCNMQHCAKHIALNCIQYVIILFYLIMI